MNTFTSQEWQELEYTCLLAQMEQQILAESNDNPSIIHRLVQEKNNLTNAYNNMTTHQQTLTALGNQFGYPSHSHGCHCLAAIFLVPSDVAAWLLLVRFGVVQQLAPFDVMLNIF